jgi:hypothetical protein
MNIEELWKNDVSLEETDTVLKILSEWFGRENTIGMWFGYSALEHETGIPKKPLQRIMAVLRKNNIVEYTTTVNLDGMVRGSGYFLHDEYIGKSWEEIKKIAEED